MTPLHEQLRELADDLSQDPRRLLIEAADRLELVEGLYEDQVEITRNWKLAADARWDRIQRLEKTLEEADAVARENLRGQEPLMRRIQRLKEALSLVRVECGNVHHGKNHRHECGQPCPVVELIEQAKEDKP